MNNTNQITYKFRKILFIKKGLRQFVSNLLFANGGSEETRTPVHIETHNDQLQLSLLDKKYSV